MRRRASSSAPCRLHGQGAGPGPFSRRPIQLVERVRSGPPAVLRPFDDALNTASTSSTTRTCAAPASRGRRAPSTTPRRSCSGRDSPPRTPAGRAGAVGVELIAPGLGKKLVKGGDQVVSVTGDPGELLLWAFGRAGAALVELSGDSESVEALRATKLGF